MSRRALMNEAIGYIDQLERAQARKETLAALAELRRLLNSLADLLAERTPDHA